MGKIAKLHKLNEQELQETIYPLTIPQAVIDPETQIPLSDSFVDITENINAVKDDLSNNYSTTIVTNAAITDAIATHNEDDTAHEIIQNNVLLADNKAEEAKTQANTAIDTAYEFSQVAIEAKTTAEAAKNAIASLEGLGDADTSQLVVADLIAKIEANTANIDYLLNRDVKITESAFAQLETKDVTKHYFIYEDPV